MGVSTRRKPETEYQWLSTGKAAKQLGINRKTLLGYLANGLPKTVTIRNIEQIVWRNINADPFSRPVYRWNIEAIGYWLDHREDIA